MSATWDDPLYLSLRRVLEEAHAQAATGKGKERHAGKNEPFEEQQIVQFGKWQETIDFNVGQAAKKAFEAKRLPYEKARSEILGAINYLAGAVLILDWLNSTASVADSAVSTDVCSKCGNPWNVHAGRLSTECPA